MIKTVRHPLVPIVFASNKHNINTTNYLQNILTDNLKGVDPS